jgi:hypothetical protein
VPERRRRRNDAIRHEVNDHIAEVAAHLSTTGEDRVLYEFLCECDRPDCRSFVRLTIEEYKELDVGNTRLVVPGHYDSTVGVVKASGTGVYAVAADE